MKRALFMCAGLLGMGLGADLFGFASRTELFGALGLGLLGFVLGLYGLVFCAAPGSLLHRRRGEIALVVGSSLVAVVIAIYASTRIQMGASAQFRRQHVSPQTGQVAQTADPEIGWAPAGPADVVGQRLTRIDPARPQVVMMGDSILYGLHLETAETAPAIMEARHPELQFLNASVSGYSIEQYWLYLRRILPATKPKVLLIGLFTGNDVQLTGREFTPWGVSKPVYAVVDGALVRQNRGDVCADALARSLLFRWLWHDQATAVQLVRLFCNPVELPMGALEATIARIFDEIEALGRAQHVRVLWVLLPTSNELSVYNPDRTRYLNKYPLLKRLLADGHHEMLDFYPEIVKSKAKLEDVFLEDRSHMRPLGHKLLADYLLGYLAAQKLL